MQTDPEFIQSIIVGIIVIVGFAAGIVWFVERAKRILRGEEN